jgi:hypothetical protein
MKCRLPFTRSYRALSTIPVSRRAGQNVAKRWLTRHKVNGNSYRAAQGNGCADAAPVLHEGGAIIDITTGVAIIRRGRSHTKRRASAIVTDRRVLIFSKKLGGHQVQDYAYGLLTGVDYKKGLSYGHLDLRAAGDSATVQQINKGEVERIAEAIRHRMALAHPTGSPEPPPLKKKQHPPRRGRAAAGRDVCPSPPDARQPSVGAQR